MLSAIGYKIKFQNSLMCVFIAFLSNLGFPRSGEILRSSSISFYEKIPFEKSFGTIITERIIDVCFARINHSLWIFNFKLLVYLSFHTFTF